MTTGPPLRLAILNDYAVIVEGLAAMLEPHRERLVVVELDVRRPTVSPVDLVLIDDFAHVDDGGVDLHALTVAGSVVVAYSWSPVAARSGSSHQRRVVGAAPRVWKGQAVLDLVASLEAIHRGERPAWSAGPDGPDGPDPDGVPRRWPGQEAGLSPRESEVLALVARGLSNQDIAASLFLGINTVKTYIRTGYRKAGVTSRTQAMLWALHHGFEVESSRSVLE